MIPESPRLFGAAQDAAKHARLVTDDAILAELAQSNGNVNAMADNGVVAFAHLYDAWTASQAIREAARLSAAEIDTLAPAEQRAAVADLWRAFGRFWQAINVSPYAWRQLRWTLEDALGYARSPLDRDRPLAKLDTSGREVAPPQPAPAAEQRKHFRGSDWHRRAVLVGPREGLVEWAPENLACWGSGGYCTVENGMDVCYPDPDAGCVVGAWRRAGAALPDMPRRRGDVLIGPGLRVRYEPGIAPTGVPNERSTVGNTGEVHRVWLWNDGTVRIDPFMRDDSRGLPWTTDAAFSTSADGAEGAFVDGYDWIGWFPPTRWYFDLLRAPRPGLTIGGAGPDISLVDYLLATSPEEVIREVRRDVLVRNILMRAQQHPPILTDEQLYGAAQVADFRRQETAAREALREPVGLSTTASAVMSSATQVATTINPIAGALVGGAEFILRLGSALTARVEALSTRHVDVFGRLMPVFEQFEITPRRTVLVSTIAAMGLPPDPEIERARRRAVGRVALDTVRAAVMRGEEGRRDDLATLATRVAGRRTVTLVGLDPEAGARIFVGDRDLTLGLPETGGNAAWTDLGGARVWRFGVPATTTSILVRYSDGRARTVDLPAVPTDAEGGEATPETRTAVVDATPPARASADDAGSYPSRTVVLVGMAPAARVFAGGVDVTGRATPEGTPARWIDTSVPGLAGWMFGVPEGTRAVTVAEARGAETYALSPLDPALDFRARVTTIDATRPRERVAPNSAAPGGTGGAWLLALAALGAGAWAFARRAPSAARANPTPRRRHTRRPHARRYP